MNELERLFQLHDHSTAPQTAAIKMNIKLNRHKLAIKTYFVTLLALNRRRGGEYTPVRFPTIGDPHLLPVNNVLVARLHSSGLDAGHVGARPRLCDTVRLPKHTTQCQHSNKVVLGYVRAYVFSHTATLWLSRTDNWYRSCAWVWWNGSLALLKEVAHFRPLGC